MKLPVPPRLEPRRAARFEAELHERARAWLPSLAFPDDEADFARALLKAAARFGSEVAERLDRVGEKLHRGFLDWLAVRGEAARPARMPVVFKLADTAPTAVLAEAGVRMQVDAGGTPVVFETETSVRLVPGRLDVLVGVDGTADAFYLPPPGLTSVDPLEPLPTEWRLKAFAAAGTDTLQLDPELGLAADMIVEAAGKQYRIVAVDKGIATIEPALDADVPQQATVRKATTFSPFEGAARNRQEHALYLGHSELLDIEAPAILEIFGASGLRDGVAWEYWGKGDSSEVDWQKLTPSDTPTANAAVLSKPQGAVETREIEGISSRWIRAYKKTAPATDQPFQTDEIGFRINSVACGRPAAPCPPAAEAISPAAEAMANTTPLVLGDVFFPLGKEPRQFDAFYLGSVEAFSKKGAEVQLCFEMADPTFTTLARVRDGLWPDVLAGVARDRALHLLQWDAASGSLKKFRDREPLQPPLPGYGGAAPSTNPVALDRQPRWRLPMWTEGFDFVVATTAGADVWVWREDVALQSNSGWQSLGQVPGPAGAVDGLVYLGGAGAQLAALRDGRVAVRAWPSGTQWNPVATLDGLNRIAFKAIVPVLVNDGSDRLVTSAAAGMVGIARDDTLYSISTAGVCVPLAGAMTFAADVGPAAVMDGADLAVVALDTSDPPLLVALHQTLPRRQVALPADAEVPGSLDVILDGGDFHFLATVLVGADGSFVSWAPFAAVLEAERLTATVPSSVGRIAGAPTAFPGHVVIPGAQADLAVAEFDIGRRHAASATVEIGIVVPDSVPALAVNDLVVREVLNVPEARRVTQAGLTQTGEVFYPIDSDFSIGAAGPLLVYDLSSLLAGTLVAPDELILDAGDRETGIGSWLRIDGEFFRVDALDTTTDPWTATISPATVGAVPASGNYVRPIATGGRVAPFMRLDPANNGDFDAGLLDRLPLIFPAETPREQRGKAFSFALGNHPVVVVLGAMFAPAAANPASFILDAALGEWRRFLGDTSTNPALSWEYWNGRGWWRLDVTREDTLHLKSTGAVQFTVPADIASSDWAGKTNHWIRARLIGGDYGRETVTVTTTPTATPGQTEQTITRSSEGIRAPSVVKLHISYRVCEAVLPTYVLARDSGSTRDQSDANRTAGAIVEAFVPLALALGRLSGTASSPHAPDECPPECGCSGDHAVAPSTPGTTIASPAATPPLALGRALFLGLDAMPSEAPVNILLLVEERRHESLAPLTIEALVGDHFVPVVASDATRALGESGVLSMAFAVPPTPWTLFGTTRRWLRLTPAAGSADEWKPVVRGAYLNAAWASATETLTRELLGSSEGAPNLTLVLARPPVLRDTLELRVKEPLGEEEREALRAPDPNRVLSAVEDLPGDWVLWRRVVDPGDEPPTARVYALDETTGEIRFGDGRHGAIPPVGRDSIVAFRYQRTEAGPAGSDTVPGNSITARTPLNLVSPVESVEAVVAADQAAGGAPAETDERVVRFGTARLRHRDRAVTPRDLEDLALQSSPDIVQARCIVRRGHVRLVIVMRGKDPRPSAAQVRELRRLLIAASPATLAATDALQIRLPRLRKLRVVLELRVGSLDHTGEVSRAVKQRIAALFDTATGGRDREGWALGENPSESDIALALIDTRHLQSLGSVRLHEVGPDGADWPWPQALQRDELVVLDDDPVRLEFVTLEVLA